MEDELLSKLADKTMTKDDLLQMVKTNFKLLPNVFQGVSSSRAIIRYSSAKVLLELSEEFPEKLYPHMDFFIDLLESKYRILTWTAIAIIANLTSVDTLGKFDEIFDKRDGVTQVQTSDLIEFTELHQMFGFGC